jgi:hypothetical protein
MRALGKRAERLSPGAVNWLLMAVENPIRYGYTRSATSIMGCDVK